MSGIARRSTNAGLRRAIFHNFALDIVTITKYAGSKGEQKFEFPIPERIVGRREKRLWQTAVKRHICLSEKQSTNRDCGQRKDVAFRGFSVDMYIDCVSASGEMNYFKQIVKSVLDIDILAAFELAILIDF